MLVNNWCISNSNQDFLIFCNKKNGFHPKTYSVDTEYRFGQNTDIGIISHLKTKFINKLESKNLKYGFYHLIQCQIQGQAVKV